MSIMELLQLILIFHIFFKKISIFDVYNFGFQCNKKRVVDYPSLWPYVREIYQMKDVTPTVNMEHINKTYHVRTPTRMRTH